MSGLTDFQVEVTRLFFSLPASDGFLLAGGGALLASGLTTRPTQDLAGRKLAALFDRAEARDFADVYALAQRFDRSVLIERAAEVDLGFDPLVLAQMMTTIDRFDDAELPVDLEDVAATRTFFQQWIEELTRPSD